MLRTVVPSTKSDPGSQIAVDFPNGGGLGYTASKAGSNIDAQSACSSDHGMLSPSK